MKNITKLLDANPALAREMAKLLKEELEINEEVSTTVLTTTQVPAGSNASEVVPAATELPAIDSATVAGAGHSVVPDLTATDPIAPAQVEQMVAEVPAAELAGEAESLEEVKKDDAAQVEELDGVIKEAMALRDSLKERIVFTESILEKVKARILVESAKTAPEAKSLTEGKK